MLSSWRGHEQGVNLGRDPDHADLPKAALLPTVVGAHEMDGCHTWICHRRRYLLSRCVGVADSGDGAEGLVYVDGDVHDGDDNDVDGVDSDDEMMDIFVFSVTFWTMGTSFELTVLSSSYASGHLFPGVLWTPPE